MTQEVFKYCKFAYYADDLAMYVHASTIKEIEEKLQRDLNNLQAWCKINSMKINIDKTKCMVFKTRSVECEKYLKLKISNKLVECVSEFQYLGLLLNEKLNFDTHFENTCKKMTQRLYMINRYKKLFSPKWRQIFSTSLVLSLVDYCLIVWGNVCNTKLKRINQIILRLAKLVVCAKQRHKLSKIDRLEQLNWILCHERLQLYTLNYIYKRIWNKSSIQECFSYFEKREETVRSSKLENNFKIPVMRTEYGKSSFFYRGIILWNTLPSQIKECEGAKPFENMVIKWIMDKRNNNEILKYI